MLYNKDIKNIELGEEIAHSKMVEWSPNMSIITLNIYGLNAIIKNKYYQTEFKNDNYMLLSEDIPKNMGKQKGWK